MSGFRVIEDGRGESIRNMAVDWILLQMRGEDVIPDTLRFYTWRKRTVSVGYSQDVSRELDPERCQESGVEVVFRPTGGSLVLHRYDLTYSVIVGIPELSPVRWSEFSRRVARALCGGLRSIGLEPACAERGEEEVRRNRGACFSRLVKHEITVDGRKIIGSAKRWRRGALLQHGSIAVRDSALSVVDLMAFLNDGERESKRKELEGCSTSIEKESGKIISCHDLQSVMLGAFEEEFGCDFEPEALRAREESRVEEFVDLVRRGPAHRREIRHKDRRLAGMRGSGR